MILKFNGFSASLLKKVWLKHFGALDYDEDKRRLLIVLNFLPAYRFARTIFRPQVDGWLANTEFPTRFMIRNVDKNVVNIRN